MCATAVPPQAGKAEHRERRWREGGRDEFHRSATRLHAFLRGRCILFCCTPLPFPPTPLRAPRCTYAPLTHTHTHCQTRTTPTAVPTLPAARSAQQETTRALALSADVMVCFINWGLFHIRPGLQGNKMVLIRSACALPPSLLVILSAPP